MKKQQYVSPQLKVVKIKVEAGYNASKQDLRNLELNAPQSLQSYQEAGQSNGWCNSFE